MEKKKIGLKKAEKNFYRWLAELNGVFSDETRLAIVLKLHREKIQTPEELSSELEIPIEKINKGLSQLGKYNYKGEGLIQEKDGKYSLGETGIAALETPMIKYHEATMEAITMASEKGLSK